MKKANFNITINSDGDTKSVPGLISKNFGIRKDSQQYSVTHLSTGYRIIAFPYQYQARAFVLQAEEIPGIDSMDLTNAVSYSSAMWEIIREVSRVKRSTR